MRKSQSIHEIAKSLALFQVKVDNISKDATNPFFKSKYASLTAILDAIKIPLSECGLSLTQFPEGEYGLTTILMHESGEYLASTYEMRPTKDDPHGKGSVISYQRRYCIQSILCLNMEDDDANGGTMQESEKEWLNKGSDAYAKVCEYMSKPDADISKVESKYKINKDIKSYLLTLKK